MGIQDTILRFLGCAPFSDSTALRGVASSNHWVPAAVIVNGVSLRKNKKGKKMKKRKKNFKETTFICDKEEGKLQEITSQTTELVAWTRPCFFEPPSPKRQYGGGASATFAINGSGSKDLQRPAKQRRRTSYPHC